MEITIDGRRIESEQDLHEILADKLDFGPYYGFNLGALWDRLSKDVPRPVLLVWLHSQESRQVMGVETFDRIKEILLAVEREDLELKMSKRFEIRFE